MALADSERDEDISTPPNIQNAALELLTVKSRKAYEKEYKEFLDWKTENKATSFSEDVLVAYFQHISEKFKVTSLWSKYSMLKSTLSLYHDVDVTTYTKLFAILKQRSDGYEAKKANTFTPYQLKTFINIAPDRHYLLIKVAVIFGIIGACRRHELYNITMQDVKIIKSTILVKICNTEIRGGRSFTITGTFFKICKKYIDLRPNPCPTSSFFLNYNAGKCTKQRVGMAKLGNLGKIVASFLKLPNPNSYTGNCFRRTSTTLLADCGGDVPPLKIRITEQKSRAVAEGYVDESVNSKIQVTNMIIIIIHTYTYHTYDP